MAILLSNCSYPTEKVKEVSDRMQEIMPKFPPPDYATTKGPFWNGDLEKGIKAFMISEVDASKLLQERLRLAAIFNALNGIEGFKWSIELWTDQSDIQARMEKYGF
jgi:hypothetical protein